MRMRAWKSRKLRKEVSHGGVVPRGWRMAWYEPRRRLGVYYPAPLNWIVRMLRELRCRLSMAIEAPPLDAAQFFAIQRSNYRRQRMADEYARGYLVGWRECFNTCVEAIEDEMSRSNNAWKIGDLLTGGDKPPQRDN